MHRCWIVDRRVQTYIVISQITLCRNTQEICYCGIVEHMCLLEGSELSGLLDTERNQLQVTR